MRSLGCSAAFAEIVPGGTRSGARKRAWTMASQRVLGRGARFVGRTVQLACAPAETRASGGAARYSEGPIPRFMNCP
jgi:hypothetical protein